MSELGDRQRDDMLEGDSTMRHGHEPHAGRRLVPGEVDLAAGLFLLVCAGLAWWFGQSLKVGTAFRMGPGFVPQLLWWTLGAFGALLVALGLLHRGPKLERWRVKPIVLILGAIVVFGLTIERGGLVVASSLAIFLSSLAAPQPRVRQALMLAATLTLFACLLFPIALQLPLRLFPW